MTYLVVDVDDYLASPENCDWTEVQESWVGDVDDAVQWFMENVADSMGRFGSNETSIPYYDLLIFDDVVDEIHMRRVTPNPMPGYSRETLDATDADYDYNIDLEKVKPA